MKNYLRPGDVLPLTAPYARSAGQGALVGSLFGVAKSDVANGAVGEFAIEGEFSLAKVSAQAWTAGAKIYWDDLAKLLTTVNTSNTFVGHASAAAANPSSTGRVRLHGAPQ